MKYFCFVLTCLLLASCQNSSVVASESAKLQRSEDQKMSYMLHYAFVDKKSKNVGTLNTLLFKNIQSVAKCFSSVMSGTEKEPELFEVKFYWNLIQQNSREVLSFVGKDRSEQKKCVLNSLNTNDVPVGVSEGQFWFVILPSSIEAESVQLPQGGPPVKWQLSPEGMTI